MLVKVGKLKKGAEKADDLHSVARTTVPQFGVKFATNGLVRTRPIGELFDILVLTNIIGDDRGNTPDKRKANWILAAFIVGKFPCGDNVMQPTHVPSRGAK